MNERPGLPQQSSRIGQNWHSIVKTRSDQCSLNSFSGPVSLWGLVGVHLLVFNGGKKASQDQRYYQSHWQVIPSSFIFTSLRALKNPLRWTVSWALLKRSFLASREPLTGYGPVILKLRASEGSGSESCRPAATSLLFPLSLCSNSVVCMKVNLRELRG